VVFASCLAAAWANSLSTGACAVINSPSNFGPSNFDYLVLASMADSPHLAAMAGYRSTAARRRESAAHLAEIAYLTEN
jgi:hypothetical protein